MYVYSRTCPLNFQCILLQVFDTSPKLNVSHSTKTNSSQRGGVWFEGPCPISLSVKQIKCQLAAESNLEKKTRVRVKSIALLQNCKIKSKQNYCRFKVFFWRKLTKMSNLILCLSEISETFICVCLKQVAFLSED